MLTNIIKFIHLLLILALSGTTIYCLLLTTSHTQNPTKIRLFNRIILWLATFAVLTGTLLIYPKSFTFHTPWIQTAFVLIVIFGTLLSIMMVLAKKNRLPSLKLWPLAYLVLATLLFFAIHDAVTKTPLINLAFSQLPTK